MNILNLFFRFKYIDFKSTFMCSHPSIVHSRDYCKALQDCWKCRIKEECHLPPIRRMALGERTVSEL